MNPLRRGRVLIDVGGNNTVQGNKIGTNATGTAGVPNTGSGVAIQDSSSGNLIGGTATGQANMLAFNGSYGIFVSTRATRTPSGGTRSLPTAGRHHPRVECQRRPVAPDPDGQHIVPGAYRYRGDHPRRAR